MQEVAERRNFFGWIHKIKHERKKCINTVIAHNPKYTIKINMRIGMTHTPQQKMFVLKCEQKYPIVKVSKTEREVKKSLS